MIEMPQNTSKRNSISKKDLNMLLGTSEPYCISIFLPTNPHGEDVLQRRDEQSFTAQIREIRRELGSLSIPVEDLERSMEPLEELRGEPEFWRNQSEGLAVFASTDWFKTFNLPMSVKPQHRLSSRFYLLPLVPMLGEAREFYLLSLELERIRLFEGTREHIKEIPLDEMIPERMEDRVGYDYEQKGLQFRSQHQAHGAAGYHGHDEADRDRKNEIQRYFQAVDKGLEPLLKGTAPLVIASQEYLASIYRKVNSYRYIIEDTLIVNLSEIQEEELRERAYELIRPWYDRDRKEKWNRFREFHGTGKATSQLSPILQAAQEGRIDTLFINQEAEVWGSYNKASGDLEFDEAPDVFSGSLLNQALILTMKHGGKVYAAHQDQMPDSAAALFRY